MIKGLIFDIKRFAVHDGPGIRTTVFFKGCPLHCRWCHNPEGIGKARELMARSSRCARCYSCLPACPLGAISQNSGPVKGRALAADVAPRAKPGAPSAVAVDRAQCDLCGRCVQACMYDALEIAGRVVTIEDVVAEVEKDRIFFEQSGGGVTLSGGEPLVQSEFCRGLLEALNKRSLPAALDTSGFATWETLWACASRADLILYDLKMMDDKKHLSYTGVSNRSILENLKKLAAAKKNVAVRIPLMAGVNDDEENLGRTIDFLRRLPSVKAVGLLRYHKGGLEKAKNLGLGKSFRVFEPLSDARMEEIRRTFTEAGFGVNIGG
jgi:pyruvate formate lyase activating enzyme